MYGEGIIERLNLNSALHNDANQMSKLIKNTIGTFLDEYDDAGLYEQLFITSATGGYLDLIGEENGVYRGIGEDDDDFRERIIYEILGHLTTDYIEKIYSLSVYVDVYDFDVDGINTIPTSTEVKLTSNNPHINNIDGYFIIIENNADNRYRTLIKKTVLGGKIKWATV